MSPLARVAFSHMVAFLFGVGVGDVYWMSHRVSTESIVSGIAREPLAQAANLAFRFGSPDHARILYEELRRVPGGLSLADGDEMFTELHLAALNGEYRISASDTPHIALASVACKRFGHSNCEPVRLKELAATFARQRRD